MMESEGLMSEIVVQWRKRKLGPMYGGPALTAAFVLSPPKIDFETDELTGQAEHVVCLECEQPDPEAYCGNPGELRWRRGQWLWRVCIGEGEAGFADSTVDHGVCNSLENAQKKCLSSAIRNMRIDGYTLRQIAAAAQ